MDLIVLRDRVLSDRSPRSAFWFCNGTVRRNIYEPASTMKGLNGWSFRNHIDSDNDKNGFAEWIAEVLGDEELGQILKNVVEQGRLYDIYNDKWV